jgi:anti-sigma factor RsiW
MNSIITPELLARYFSGDCAGEEEALVEGWLFESPAHAAQAEAWLKLAGEGKANTSREVVEVRAEARDRVMKRITGK